MTDIIAIPDDRPPLLTYPPCNYRGCVWSYMEPTPENARRALLIHERDWGDWPVDDALVALAQSPNKQTEGKNV